MEDIITQVKGLAKGSDDVQRRKLIGILRDLAISLETPEESVERISFTPLELYMARVASDLGLFELLSLSNSPLHVAALTEQTGADAILLARVIRIINHIASVNMVDETDDGAFLANNVTHALGTPKGKDYMDIYTEFITPAFHKLPEFLAKADYWNPTNSLNVPFQDAFEVDSDIFEFLRDCPRYGTMFGTHMKFQRDACTDWSRVLKIMEEKKDMTDHDIAFVDLGGGVGHQCARLKAASPNLRGRVILQDLPELLNRSLTIPGVEKRPCDLLNSSPAEGAKIYYIRGVLHDFPDDGAKQILRNISEVMATDSVLLVDEIVLPEKDIHWQATSMDLQLLSFMGSQERTRTDWTQLLDSVGLKLLDINVHKPPSYESLISVMKPL